MSRHINDEGIAKIKSWEGLRLTAYQDSGGVWTVGYGHTKNVHKGLHITQDRADALLREDLVAAETAVSDLVTAPLTDNQFSALVSFVFNVGVGAFTKSTLLKKINQGDYTSVPNELMKWNKVGKKVEPGLVNRRAAEIGLWAKGSTIASQYVEPTPSKGKLTKLESVSMGLTSVGTASTVAANQLAPVSDYSPIIKAVCVTLIVIGVIAGFYAMLRNKKDQST